MDELPVKVSVARKFAAPAARVFDAWLSPAIIGQWAFSKTLMDQQVLHIEIDPRVGGTFSFLVRRGGVEIDHVGTYLEIERPRRLVFTWGVKGQGDTSKVTLELVEGKGKTTLSLTHEMAEEWRDFAKRAEESWGKTLEEMGKVVG